MTDRDFWHFILPNIIFTHKKSRFKTGFMVISVAYYLAGADAASAGAPAAAGALGASNLAPLALAM